MPDQSEMPSILLVGTNLSLLEGLAQSLSAQGHRTRVATSFSEARELTSAERPLIAVVEREMATNAASEVLSLGMAAGGAVVLYRSGPVKTLAVPHALQRHILADLALPLERNRLVALVQHVSDRANAAGRGRISGETELTS
jgi:DNA-binding NtrC family response regulator